MIVLSGGTYEEKCKKVAAAYAHIGEAIDNWDSLLNVIYDTMLREDMKYVRAIGSHMEKAKKELEKF
jgi:hypothetical protein